jgi:hypothetical protein
VKTVEAQKKMLSSDEPEVITTLHSSPFYTDYDTELNVDQQTADQPRWKWLCCHILSLFVLRTLQVIRGLRFLFRTLFTASNRARQRSRRARDVPTALLVLFGIGFLLIMGMSLFYPGTRNSNSKWREPEPGTMLHIVSYYNSDHHHTRNSALAECSSGYSDREPAFDAAHCVQQLQSLQATAGWSETALRQQEKRLLLEEEAPCLCAPMYGASFPRLTLPMSTGLTLHCFSPRVRYYSNEMSSIQERVRLFPEEYAAGGRKVTRRHAVALLCLTAEKQTSEDGSIAQHSEDIVRFVKAETAHCVQLCVELLTGQEAR